MLRIEYRINKDLLMDFNFNYSERPVIYGVFVIESDFGLYFRDLAFIDDAIFELFNSKDDLFLWFLNITLMNLEILKNKESKFIIGYGLENLPPHHGILFQRTNNTLHISEVVFSDNNYPIFIFSKDLPKNLTICEKYKEIFVSTWINESLHKTKDFINEIINYNPKFEDLEYVKLIKDSLIFIQNSKNLCS